MPANQSTVYNTDPNQLLRMMEDISVEEFMRPGPQPHLRFLICDLILLDITRVALGAHFRLYLK